MWAGLIVEELARCGVRCFCIAPGLRSAPLALAAQSHPDICCKVHHDERGLGFFALGYGRATGNPAAWITTSGTAVANGLPAAVEAARDKIPMVLLTADRPPELRDTDANQTIDQVGIFGKHVRWAIDLPPPSDAVAPTVLLTSIDQAVYRSKRSPQGPVHINWMLREPLVGGVSAVPSHHSLKKWRKSRQPYTEYSAEGKNAPGIIPEYFAHVRRGLLIAGRLKNTVEAAAIMDLAQASGWPLLPDICSFLRLGYGDRRSLVGGFDRLLASETFRRNHVPDGVIQFGGSCVSKHLRSYLHLHLPYRYMVVDSGPERIDPDHIVTHRVEAAIPDACAKLHSLPLLETAWSDAWYGSWVKAEQRTRSTLQESVELSEPTVARIITSRIPEKHALVLASSLSIRTVDRFGSIHGPRVRVAANRGASGIDGTIATAAGFAFAAGQPATVLIGDLALLHDLNSLSLAHAAGLVMVVLNNDGGGIFHFISGAEQESGFETVMGTPHGYQFGDAARMFGINYCNPGTREEFEASYRDACRSGRSALIEVTTDRHRNMKLHKALMHGST